MNKMYRDQTTQYFSGVDAKNFNLSPLERRKKTPGYMCGLLTISIVPKFFVSYFSRVDYL